MGFYRQSEFRFLGGIAINRTTRRRPHSYGACILNPFLLSSFAPCRLVHDNSNVQHICGSSWDRSTRPCQLRSCKSISFAVMPAHLSASFSELSCRRGFIGGTLDAQISLNMVIADFVVKVKVSVHVWQIIHLDVL